MSDKELRKLIETFRREYSHLNDDEFELALALMSMMNASYVVSQMVAEDSELTEALATTQGQFLSLLSSKYPELNLKAIVPAASDIAIRSAVTLSELYEAESHDDVSAADTAEALAILSKINGC